MTVKEWYTTYNFAIMQKSNENIALYKDFIFKLREETGLTKKEIVSKMLDEVAPLFKERNGGYTRIQRTIIRSGDRAEMARISLVENLKPKAIESTEVKAKKVKEPKVVKEDKKLIVEKAEKKPVAKKVKKAEVKE
jgi:large subunit ribosomal protein L17